MVWSHDLLGIKMASVTEDVVLEDELYLLRKKKGLHKVILTRRGLYFHAITNNTTYEEVSLQISDIVGCHRLEHDGVSVNGGTSSAGTSDASQNASVSAESDNRTNSSTSFNSFPKLVDPSTCGFVVFAYPFRKKRFSGKRVRYRYTVAFEIPAALNEIFEERVKVVEQWRNVINCLARDLPVNVSEVPSCVPPPRGKLLLLINPHSGPGKANIIFKNQVAPMLYEAGFPYKAIVTDHAGHASEMLKSMDLSEWYGVVIISGDGLIFETINGIMQRDDWATSIKFPLGCLPGGSGNALCCAITYAAGEPIDSSVVLHSTFVLVKHKIVPMDLVALHIPDRTVFSFLSVTWGMLADIDYESEKYRNLGEARFTVGAIKRIFRLRTYKGRISFLPVAEYSLKEPASSSKVLSKIRRFSLRSQSGSKSTLDSLGNSPSNSPKLLSKRSLSMGASGYSEVQLRHAEGKTTMNGNVQTDDAQLRSDSFIDDEENNISEDFNTRVAFGLDQIEPSQVSEEKTNINNSKTEEENNVSISSVGGGDNVTKTSDLGQIVLPSAIPQIQADGVSGDLKTDDNSNDASGIQPATLNIDSQKATNTSISAKSVSFPSSTTNNISLGGLSSNDLNKNSVEKTMASSETVETCKVERNRNMTILSETREVGVEEETYHGKKADFAPVPTPLLPPLDEEVPQNWVTLDGEFVLMAGVYQTHLGSDMLAAPDAHLCDGHIHLMMVREGISKNALLNLFLSFAQGSHLHSPYVDYVKVLAFRLEPASTNGNIMVDGERFSPSPIQGQILPGLARVMAIK